MLYKNIDELYAAREKRKKAQTLNIQSALLNYIGGQVGRLSAFDDDAMKYASTGISGNFKNYDKEKKSGAFQWDKKKRDEYEQKAKTNWQAVKEIESIYLNNKDLIDANYGTQIADLVSNAKSYKDLYDSIRQKNSYFDSIKSPVEGVSNKTWYEYANQYSDASFEDLRKKASLLEGASRRRNLTDTEKELITAMKFDADQKEERHKIVDISPEEWKKKIKALEKEKSDAEDENNILEDAAKKIGWVHLISDDYDEQEAKVFEKSNEILEAKAYYNASLVNEAKTKIKEGAKQKVSNEKAWKIWEEAVANLDGFYNPLDYNEDKFALQKNFLNVCKVFGEETALEYLDKFIETEGLHQKAFEAGKEWMSEHYFPVVSEALTLGANFTPKIVTDALSLASMGASALAGEEWKPNNWWNLGALTTEAQTEMMRDSYSSEFGKQAFDVVIGLDNLAGAMYGTSAITGGTKQVLGNQGKNIVTRSLKSALSDKNAGNIMGGLMSTSAAAGTTREAISRGVDTRTALAYGAVNGAIEFFTEKIGYDRLMGIMGSDSTKTALTKEIAKHFGAEAMEGATSTALDYVADRLINGEMSKYSQNIQTRMANGESYQEALANAKSDLGKEILIGAIQEGSIGAIMGGGGAVVARNITRNMYGNQITNNGAVDILVDQANKLGVNTRGIESPSANMTEAQQDKYFNKVGKVYEQTLNEMVKGKLGTQEGDAIFKDAVKSRLEMLHSDNIEETSIAIQKQMNGKKLTEGEKALLETKQAKRVVSEIENSNDDRYDADWAFAMEAAITNAKAESNIKTFAMSLLTSENADVQKLSNIINNETEQNDFANTEDINVSTQNTDSFLVGEEFVEGQIKSIKTDKDGNISVVFEGVDEAVPLANTELSEQNAELISYAREFGADAEIMYEAFKMGNTENVGKYALAFRYVYDMAEKGATESYLRDSKYSQYLNDSQFNVAYKLGNTKADNVKDTAPEFKKMTKVGSLTLTEDVKNRMKRGKINKRQISSIYALRSLTDALGINIVVYKDKITVSGITTKDANGFFDPQTNTIYLEINAGKDATDKTLGEYAILRTLSHELTHFIAQNSPEQFKILQRFIFSHLDEYKGKTLDELINKEMAKNKTLSPEGAAEEIVAQACEMMLQNSSVVEVFAYQNPNLAKKMGNFISNFKKNVYKALEKIGAKSEPAKAMKNYLDELQEIWDNALAKAVMNYQASEGANGKEDIQTDRTLRNGKRDVGEDKEPLKFELKTDAEYMSAVDNGDMETAQRLVDETAKKLGYTTRAYHGTARGDRVGNVFLPERATSGPMAFFTSDKQIAENYSRDKKDTSLNYDEEYADYYSQFRVQKNGKSISVPDLWNTLSFAEKAKIKERAHHITLDENSENIIYDTNAKYGLGAFDAYRINENNGNYLRALVDEWLVDGNLWGEEHRFIEVLELAGLENVEYRDPDAKHEKVYDTFLKIENPFDTANANESFIAELESWYDAQDHSKYEVDSNYADMWDKNNRDAYDFANRLRDDLESGKSFAWTSIPDAVTDFLKSKGYDGIQDTGGKSGGDEHIVYIPFSSEQIKSADPVTYDDNGNVIPLSERFSENNPDIRFERKSDSSKSQKEMEFLLGYYKALSKETQGKLFTKTSIEGIAKDILKKNESTYNKFDLMTDIQNVYAMIVDEKGGKVAYNDVFNELLKVSDKVYANIRPSDIPQENKDILNTIRAQKIYLSPEMVSEGAAVYGGKKEFYEAWKGKIRFTYSDKKAVSLDTFLYYDGKEFNIDPKNPVKGLIDLYNDNRYVEDQFVSYHEDEIKEQIATDIYESFGHAVAVASHSDVLMRKYQKLSQKSRELSHYERADVLRKVQSKASMLQSLLVSNNKNKHVPDALKLPLGEFLERLDFSSRRYLNEGNPTYSDIEFFKSFANLKKAMEEYKTLLEEGEDISVNDLDVAVSTIEAFNKVYKELDKMPEGEIKLNELSLPALQSLNSALYSLRVSINKANALYDESRKESVSKLAQQMNNYLLEFPEAEENLNWLMKQLKWNNLLPVYAFDLLGDVGKTLYKSLTKAENVRQDLLVQLENFMKKTYTPTEQKHWQEKVQTYNFGDGNTLQLRDSDAMYLWTLLNRESMTEHASVGGLGVEQRKIKRKTFKSQRAKIVDPEGDYAKRKAQIKHAQDVIGAKLSERQKKVATEIQRYMSDECAKQGNYVSQARWGISMFLEKAYMPARVEHVNGVESQIRSEASNTSIYALLNPSFTKPLVEGANTVLLAQDIFDVFVEHAMNMATYRAYALPLLDMTRIMNFSRNVDGNIVGVQKSLKKAYGNDGQRYFREFLQNLNGKSDSQEIMAGFLGGLLRAGKAVGTGANLRVAFLQPTAALRASAELGDWAITKGMVKGVTKGNGYSKAKKYSAFAKVKEMGSYGVNLSTPIAKRLKNQTSIRDKAIDKSFALAQKGDQFLFNIIWNACEHITAKESKLQVGSDEWYRECAERFDDVIARTQVVDSPLTKSPAMNSKSIMDMTTTAFMSEPTVTNNVLFAPLRENEMAKKRGMPAKQRMRKFIKPALVSLKVFTAQAMIVSLIESLWDVWRDDEKEEELHVRLLEHFVQNMYENINPIRNVPLGNTLMEKLDGLILSLIKDKETKKSVEKVLGKNFGNETILDTTIADIFSVIDQASKIITKEELVKEDWMNLADAATKTFSLISGIPFSGVLREVSDLYNNIIDIVNADEDLKWSTREKTESEKTKKFFEDYEKAVLETKKVKEVKSLVNELLKEEVKKAKEKGKEKPVDYAYSQIRAKFTRQYKELYQEAYAKKDTKEMNRIYRLLEASGVYNREKTYGLYKATEQWKEDYKEDLEEKKRAENYEK